MKLFWILLLILLQVATPCLAARPLKEDTAVVKVVGPFVDATGAAVTAPTIASIDITAYKNDGTAVTITPAASGTSNDMAHTDDGYFSLELTATDTSTPGDLRLTFQIAGSLIFHEDFTIHPANVYDSLYGSDKLQVDVVEAEGTNVSSTSGIFDSNLLTIESTGPGTWYQATDFIAAQSIQDGAIDAGAIATDAIGALEWASGATSEVQNGLATTTSLNNLITTVGTAGNGLTAIPWAAAWDAEVQSEVDDALIAKGLDHLVFASVTGTDVADNSIFARMVSKSATADWDTFVQTTDSQEAIRDRGDAAWLTATGFATSGGLATLSADVASLDAHVGDVETIVVAIENQTDDIGVAGAGLTAVEAVVDNAAIADAVWDEAFAGHVGAGSFGKLFNDIYSAFELDGPAYRLTLNAVSQVTFPGLSPEDITSISEGIIIDGELIAEDVWAATDRVLTAGTNIVLAKGTGVTGFNDITTAQVATEVAGGLLTYDGPTNAEMVARTRPTAEYATAAALTIVDDFVDGEITQILADIAAVENQTDDIGAAGAGLTAIDLPNQTMNITGSITGNLSGTIGGVASGGINSASFAANAIDANAMANNTIDSDALATTAVTEIQTGLATSANQTTILADIATVENQTDDIGINGAGLTAVTATISAADIQAAIGLTSANLDTQLADLPTVSEFNARTITSATYATSSAQTTAQASLDLNTANIVDLANTVDSNAIDIDTILTLEIETNNEVDDMYTAFELDGVVYRLTTNAVEQVVTGTLSPEDIDAIAAAVVIDEEAVATAVWASTTRTLTAGTNIVLTKGTGLTGLNDLSAAQVNTEVDTGLADYDGPTNAELNARTLLAADYFNPTTDLVDVGTIESVDASDVFDGIQPLDAAAIREAVGLATNNLDTQLADIPTVAELNARTLVAANYATSMALATLQTSVNTIDDLIDDEIAAIQTALGTIDGILDNIFTAFELDTGVYRLTEAALANVTVPALSSEDIDAIAAAVTIDVEEVATAVWTHATRVLTAGTNIVLAKGTGLAGLNDLSAADVNAQADLALADYDGPTNAELIARTIATANYATSATQATILADIAVVESQTDDIGEAGAGLTALELDLDEASIAAAVRTNLAVELARLDVAVGSRLATAGYTAPATVGAIGTAVRAELATELGRIDVASSTRLAASSYVVPPTVAAIRDTILAAPVGAGTVQDLFDWQRASFASSGVLAEGAFANQPEQEIEVSISQDNIDAIIDGIGDAFQISPEFVDKFHIWRFDASGTVTATNTINEAVLFDALVAMTLEKTIPDEVSVSTVDSVSVVTRAGDAVTTEVVLGTPTITPDQMGFHIPLTANVAGQYVVSVTFTTTDSQTLTRKGNLVIR